VIILAHGGTAGAVAESIFLAVPVLIFMGLSRWSKRKARRLEAEEADNAGDGGQEEDGP
jgi:hypothetical protein